MGMFRGWLSTAVIHVLSDGSPLQREEGAYVLGHIGTGKAWEAVKERLPKEEDRKVRKRIEELLNHRSKKTSELI